MKVRIFRYQKGSEPGYDTFEIDPPEGMTVLSALFHIQDRFDDSLAFRYSCRGAVCGSCAMLINKIPRLACRTQLSRLLEEPAPQLLKPYPAITKGETPEPGMILIEPLPHLPVQKDLMVDMERFFEFFRAVDPVFKPGDKSPERERIMDPSDVQELEHYTNCVLCAACFGACPVSGEAPEFIGPAALAKLYRFSIDPREGDNEFRLASMNTSSGWWGCQFHGNCKRVCPKGVPPNFGIGKARRKLKEMGRGEKDRGDVE